jgi:hypothetical protein
MIDFWMCETGTGQQVVQLRDSYVMMMIMIMMTNSDIISKIFIFLYRAL